MATDTISDLQVFLELQTRLHGANSAQAAAVMFGLGKACLERNSFKKAEEWLRQALHIQERVGADAEAIADTRRALDKALGRASRQPRIDETADEMTLSSDRLPVFRMPLEPVEEVDEEIQQSKLEIDSLRRAGCAGVALADALLKLAKQYGNRKMLDVMEPLLLEALSIRETELGAQHLSVSLDLKNLGRLYYFLERYEEAEQLFRRAMNIRASALGPLHPLVADIAKWYSKTLRACDRHSEAVAMEALVRECQAKDGTDWENYKSAGIKAMAEENYVLAQAMWLAALDESQKFGQDDPRLCTTLENLAEVYWKQAKYDRAESLCQRILMISERVLGAEHSDVAQAAKNLALVCDRQGKYAEASMLYQQALTITEKLHGLDHPTAIAIRECHERTRRLIQKQVEVKVEKSEGRWAE
ncbi:MAG TPA: tetratricopeptide repeat protein [Trichormus sp.]